MAGPLILWYKKIRHGLDLLGNKIINAKVNNPVDLEDIANKQYVDVGDKYDTVLSTTKPVSTKFDWVQNVGNTTLKSTLDKLLFPIVYPKYLNPTLKEFKFNTNDEINFVNSNIEGILNFDINNNDRLPTISYKLIVKRTDENELIFSSLDKDSLSIPFSFVWKNIEYIKLTQIFTPVTIKNDSDGNPYSDNSFNTTFNFSYTFNTIDIEKSINIKKQLYFKVGESISQATLNILKTEAELKQIFTIGNNIPLLTQNSNNFNNLNSLTLLIHESQVNNTNSNIIFSTLNKVFGITHFLSSKYVLRNAENLKQYVTFADGKYYVCFVENVGKFNTSTTVKINL